MPVSPQALLLMSPHSGTPSHAHASHPVHAPARPTPRTTRQSNSATPRPSAPAKRPPSERLFLGARALASLNVPGACPACFYLRTTCRRELPYQSHFPSILFAADRQVKEAVHRSLDTGRGLPPWMPVLGRVAGYVPGLSYKWFRHLDRRTNVSACGVPDDLLVMADGGVHVVDYKTAYLSKKQREVMPLYEAQVSVYAYIARRVGRRVPGPVRGLTLVYLEPRPDYDDERKLTMRFGVKAVAVPNHAEELVPQLLARAREIVREAETTGSCPRHAEGCEELARMDRLMEAQTGDPFVATYGRYHEGRCLQCGERGLLAPGTESCFLCREMEAW